jgi:HK97 family phage prohead protease
METRTTFHRGNKKLEARLDGEGDNKKIVGYAAVYYDGTPETEYELWPGVRERILPGAFDGVLGNDVRGLFNHDVNQVLGRTTSGTCRLSVDSVGLRYEIEPPDTQCGRDTKTVLARKDVTGSSFSFCTKTDRWTRNDDGTEIRELVEIRQLFDVGPVTFPAYEATTAGVRAQRDSGGVDEARACYDAWHAARDAEAVEVDARWAEISSQFDSR